VFRGLYHGSRKHNGMYCIQCNLVVSYNYDNCIPCVNVHEGQVVSQQYIATFVDISCPVDGLF
jgi:hypothetical protein